MAATPKRAEIRSFEGGRVSICFGGFDQTVSGRPTSQDNSRLRFDRQKLIDVCTGQGLWANAFVDSNMGKVQKERGRLFNTRNAARPMFVPFSGFIWSMDTEDVVSPWFKEILT